jgi:hypothetical protein
MRSFTFVRGIFRGASLLAPVSALVAAPPALNAKGKDKAAVVKKDAAEIEQQYREAVAWCQANQKRGFAAWNRGRKDGSPVWPDVTEGSVNRRLDNPELLDNRYGCRSALSTEEEDAIACATGISFEERKDAVFDALKARAFAVSTGTASPLSAAARGILKAGHVADDFLLGCKQAAKYSGCGSGFVFRSALWHRTMYGEPGVWKLALFYGNKL